MEKTITTEMLERFDRQFHASRANLVAMNAVCVNGVNAAATRRDAQSRAVHQYNLSLDQHGVTNQKSSGRCWMFAALNCLRFQVIHKLGLEKFELSQNFTLFYDKLEKANYFLETVLANTELEPGSRELDHLLQSPEQDGGQWDMIRALMEKYGVVPKEAMPESACSSGTKEMNTVLTEKLREDACRLREAAGEGKTAEQLREMKKSFLKEVYRILCICLGEPPERFDLCLHSKEHGELREQGLTPKEFYNKYVAVDLSEYVSVIHAPTADKPYYRSYTVKFLGNVVGGCPVKYVNVPMEILKQAAIAQLKDGEPVWFGCDVGKHSQREGGVMDTRAFDYATLMSSSFDLNKADRLEYGHSQMTHAMVFQGVELDENGKSVRWRVENSWGEDRGAKGMYLMTDEWFDEYMYQIVVQKKYLPAEVLAAYEAEPLELAPWDPMGSLA